MLDEAPFIFLTSYDVTIFMRRQPDVRDKRILVSEPVWWNQRRPCPRICWLHMLELAAELDGTKLMLPRMLVPGTGVGCCIESGYLGQLGSSFMRKMQRLPEQAAQPGMSQCTLAQSVCSVFPRKSPRTAAQRAGRRDTASLRQSGLPAAQQAAQPCSSCPRNGKRAAEEQADQPRMTYVQSPNVEEVVPLSWLGEKLEELGPGRHGHTLKVSVKA